MDLLRIFSILFVLENYHNGAIFLQKLLHEKTPIKAYSCILKNWNFLD